MKSSDKIKAKIIGDKIQIIYESEIKEADLQGISDKYSNYIGDKAAKIIAEHIADKIHGQVFSKVNMDAIIRLTEIEVSKNLADRR